MRQLVHYQKMNAPADAPFPPLARNEKIWYKDFFRKYYTPCKKVRKQIFLKAML